MRQSPTKYVVGLCISAPMIYFTFALTDLRWGMILTSLLAYEAWTLVNPFPEDTISEIIWEYAKRPMIPCIFGFALGIMLTSGYLSNVYMTCIVGFLYGHFFFQRQQ